MKSLLTAAILAVAALMLGATLVLTCAEPSPNLLPAGVDSTGQSLALSKPTPLYLDNPPANGLLQSGVYQTYPWTIIVVVPGAGMNAKDFAVKPNTNSPMPIIQPHVKVVPVS